MLFSYKMTDDEGFAPNPFHSILTLATCKPKVRLKKQKGDYIAGFTSKALCGEKIGHERLVYIMRVTEKITYDEYWNSPRFSAKKPNRESKINLRGDNIYKPIANSNKFKVNNYEQVINFFHGENEKPTDLSGQFVLLSEEFFYFGIGAIPVDNFKINIPKGRSPYGTITTDGIEIGKLLKFLSNTYPRNVTIGMPHGF